MRKLLLFSSMTETGWGEKELGSAPVLPRQVQQREHEVTGPLREYQPCAGWERHLRDAFRENQQDFRHHRGVRSCPREASWQGCGLDRRQQRAAASLGLLAMGEGTWRDKGRKWLSLWPPVLYPILARPHPLQKGHWPGCTV